MGRVGSTCGLLDVSTSSACWAALEKDPTADQMPQLQMCCCQPRRGPGGSSRQSISRIGCLFHPQRGVSRTSLLPSSPTFLPEEKDGCPVTGVVTLTDISSSALTHRRLPMPLPRLTPSSPSRGLGGAFSPKQSPFLPLGFAPFPPLSSGTWLPVRFFSP